jgi:hypothetical protein
MDEIRTDCMLPAAPAEVAVKEDVIVPTEEAWSAGIPNEAGLGQEMVLGA